MKSSIHCLLIVPAFLFLLLVGCSGGATMGENAPALNSASKPSAQGGSDKGNDEDGLGTAGIAPGPIPSHSDPQDSPPDEKKGYQQGE